MALSTVVRKTAKLAPCFRMFATKSEAEVSLSSILTQSLDAQVADVTDVSGGCGSMFKVLVVSPKFEGVNLVKQHRLVKDALKTQIADMHGLTVKTMTPAKWNAASSAAGARAGGERS